MAELADAGAENDGNKGTNDDNNIEGNADGEDEHNNPGSSNDNPNGNGCTYKEFMTCNLSQHALTSLHHVIRIQDRKEKKYKEMLERKEEEKGRLVLSCCVIFDIGPLSLSFDLVFHSEILKYFPCLLCHFRHLVILCLDRHAHTMHYLENLLTISLDNLFLDSLDILKEDHKYQSCIIDTSSIHIESRKLPTAMLFDDDTGRISIRHYEILKSITLNVLA
ncbi:hypothetical protein Tco_0989594 [Tanacetum coccineum]|uniref:Uncharacterized protein n=1 Tax=Tanacetum coccineum TaxID=301880 RepID=A0ABQ5EV76_9ASTR